MDFTAIATLVGAALGGIYLVVRLKMTEKQLSPEQQNGHKTLRGQIDQIVGSVERLDNRMIEAVRVSNRATEDRAEIASEVMKTAIAATKSREEVAGALHVIGDRLTRVEGDVLDIKRHTTGTPGKGKWPATAKRGTKT